MAGWSFLFSGNSWRGPIIDIIDTVRHLLMGYGKVNKTIVRLLIMNSFLSCILAVRQKLSRLSGQQLLPPILPLCWTREKPKNHNGEPVIWIINPIGNLCSRPMMVSFRHGVFFCSMRKYKQYCPAFIFWIFIHFRKIRLFSLIRYF